MDNEIINNGAFEGRGDTDFAGGTLPFEVRIPDSDWNKAKYLPTGEDQYGRSGDKLNCVTQSNHNSFELQLNQMITDKTISVGHLDWLSKNGYLGNHSKVNFSEKFNSILNKTAEYKGNWLHKVANDSRKSGLIPQSLLPELVNEDWDTYYNKNQIIQEMRDLGKEFLTMFDITYEWINDINIENIVEQLQHTPIQIIIPNHAIVEILSKKALMEYYDSYYPYVKEKPQSKVTSYLKLVIKPIMTNPKEIKIIKDANSNAVGIWYAAKNPEELIAQAKEAGFIIPLNPDNSLSWRKFIQGELKINKSMGIIKKIFNKVIAVEPEEEIVPTPEVEETIPDVEEPKEETKSTPSFL